MNKFTKQAAKATSISPLIEGREKVTMDNIIAKYPDGITVNGFDLVEMTNENTGELESVPVLIFAENDKEFFFGGKVLFNIVRDWLSMYEGDIETTCTELAKEGGVKMQFVKGVTKKNKPITKVKIVE